MNELDGKVIVDREVFVGILDMARRGLDSGFFGEVYHQDFAKGEQALAADLTGWAAVLVEPTWKQEAEGAKFVNPDGSDVSTVYNAMLAASPPLPGGGE